MTNDSRETSIIPETTGIKQDTKFKPGQSGNPAGRPKGSRNFSTLFNEAIKKIAEEKGVEATKVEMDMVRSAILRALNGDIGYYRDTMDRIFGKAPQSIDITSGGEQIGLSAEDKAKLDKLLSE